MTHPYTDMPAYRSWRAAMSGRGADAIEPFPAGPLRMAAADKVMTAGSCFAQHISRYLKARGLPFVDTEPAHPLLSAKTADAFGYGLYSARYGNIYTSRQLLQLLRRACGTFHPVDVAWEDAGAWFDPFRPAIQPGGFSSRRELQLDTQQHLAAVRRAFEQMDVLVFTMGLTECWLDQRDGAAYPVCPGTAAGRYDESIHGFVNLDVDDVVADMTAFIDELRQFNSHARLILTVSPVPLVATALDRHVLVSTTLSKSVLRVAAEKLTGIDGVHYFPAYEIVTCGGTGNTWFDADRRSVREVAVAHVMRQFFKRVADMTAASQSEADADAPSARFAGRMREIVDTLCDERHLDPPG